MLSAPRMNRLGRFDAEPVGLETESEAQPDLRLENDGSSTKGPLAKSITGSSRMVDMQVDEGLPVYVIPGWPIERVREQLRRQAAQATEERQPLAIP